MRWHDILFGTLLTVSIVDFALAAPVPVQEKRHACVDAVHVPKDGMNVLEKRVDYWMDLMNVDDFGKLMEEHFGSELPKAPESSSSAPLGPDHGSNLHMAGPPPNVESSTSTNLADGDDFVRPLEEHFGSELPKTPKSSSSAPAAPLGPDHGSNLRVAGPAPNVESSTSTNPAPLLGPSSLSLTGPSIDYFAKQAKGSFKTGQEPVESSQVQPSSSPAPLWSNHVSMTDMQAPAPNTAASTTNPVPFMKPPSLSSTRPSTKSAAYIIDFTKPPDNYFKMGQKPVESSNAHVPSSAAPLPWPNYPPKLDVPALAQNLASPTVNPDPLMEPPSVLSTESQKADLGIYHSIKMAKLTGELPSVLSTESRKVDLGRYYGTKLGQLEESAMTSKYRSSGAYGWKSSAPSWPNHGSMTDMQAAPNLASSTVNPAPKPPSLPGQTFEPTPLGPPQPPRWTRKRPRLENPGMPTSAFDYDYPQER